jgi:hypothetical protein
VVVEAFMSARTPIILLLVALLEAVVRERITRIRIASGEDRIELLRQGEGFDETWSLEEPKQAPADPEAIEDYLRNWEFALPVRTLQSPSAEDLQSFGIDTPKAEVTFEMGRAKVRVSLGSGSPVDGGGYVRIDDHRQVTVVSDDVVALFERTADAFELKGDAGAPDLSELIGAQEDAAVAAP